MATSIGIFLIAGLALGFLFQIIFSTDATDIEPKNSIVFILITVLLVPFAEEIFFRGYLANYFKRVGIIPIVIIVLTAFLWSIAHQAYHPIKILIIFALGCGLMLVKQRYENLWPGIGFHVGFNTSYWWWMHLESSTTLSF